MKIGTHIVAFILFLITLSACNQKQDADDTFYNYLPEDTILVYKITPEDSTSQLLETIASDFSENRLLSQIKSGLLDKNFNTNPILKQIEISCESLLAFSKNDSTVFNYTFVTKQPKEGILLDSIKDKKVETLQFEMQEVTKVTSNKQEVFYATIDSTLVISSAIIPIKNFISKTIFKDSTFQKLVRMPSKIGLTILKNTSAKNGWSSVHLKQDEALIQASGILVERDTVRAFLSYFKDQVPQQLTIASALPKDIKTATVFTYSDAELLIQNLREFKVDSTSLVSLAVVESFNEIAQVHWKNNSYIFAKSMDSQIALSSLEAEISEVKKFRNTIIYAFNSPDYFSNLFSPIGVSTAVNFVFEFNGYFIFCPSEISAETMSTAIMSDAVLSKTNAFKDIAQNLTRSITYAEIAQNEEVPALLNDYIGETEKNLGFKKIKGYKLAIAQYTFENNFAHINFVTSETLNKTTSAAGVSAPTSFTIKEAILGNPVFYTTRGSRRKSVAFQDMTNTLRSYSNDGTLSWSKKVNEPILGDINEVDVKRNGRKQLAFTTKNKMHVIDEKGKDVAPFPISFKDEITQPLAVFDYDNNRKYRFVITQGKEVVMLDSKGKTVKGFTYKKASSRIVATPQHIRLNNKDYLLVQEENGRLNILSRTGKERIKVNSTFKFNGSAVQRDTKSFVLITSENERKTISQSGKVTTKKMNVASDYFYRIDAKMKVSLNDNLLRINGKLIELPFGIYTTPNLYYVNKTGYVSVTETQESKVYVYKNNGTLIKGFPVYGTSSTIITDISKSKSLQILVAGDNTELLKYQIK